MKRFYEYEIRTPKEKIEKRSGWHDAKMLAAIAEIEQKLPKGCRLRAIERMSAMGKKGE
jgi:hypothetical protein